MAGICRSGRNLPKCDGSAAGLLTSCLPSASSEPRQFEARAPWVRSFFNLGLHHADFKEYSHSGLYSMTMRWRRPDTIMTICDS
ncbi:hypothetical protein DOTSEDRAFT_83072 [Dothistroma septosporum NZE10]|uniref:Uncharacterized protein n=1 Tax=Dothistroma septosporum (strain NZE10 / CBS 128990) TaxID=675120 RepID=M2YJY4_DOTSN|nr:hypothetical protein DOTSEDRAFT_83072 [Dothistroma septosporum NZE10]